MLMEGFIEGLQGCEPPSRFGAGAYRAMSCQRE